MSTEALAAVPITTKEAMLADPDGFREPDTPVQIVQHTTGTTGTPLFIQRGAAELDYIAAFFRALQDDTAQPWVLSLHGNYHGMPTPVPYAGRSLELNLNDRFWNLESLVAEPWTLLGGDPGPVTVVGLESQVRELTSRLVESDFNFVRSAVVSVMTTGDHVTPRLHQWYESTWGVPHVSRYGLTEVFGGASPCHLCGRLHLDPFVIGEVVDPYTRERVEAGFGVLLLTCLFPFVQKQPVLRYWTGDLVELGPRDCPMDDFGFSFEGRLASCVLRRGTPGEAPLVAGARLFDILDSYPDIATTQIRANINGVVRPIADHASLGPVRARLDVHEHHHRTVVRVDVEMRYSHYHYRDRTAQVCTEIRERILASHPRLDRLVSTDEVDLQVRPRLPGTLASFLPDEVE